MNRPDTFKTQTEKVSRFPENVPSPLLFDGAFGTLYFNRHANLESGQENDGAQSPCELACLTHPQRVREIHDEYLQAGATAIKTNTFSANTYTLKTGFDYVREILTAGWKIAMEAVAAHTEKAVVFCDIGPISTASLSDDAESQGQIAREYQKIADVFLKLGGKYFLLETMHTPDIFNLANYIKRQAPDSFVLVSFAAGQDGYTTAGIPLREIIEAGNQSEADALGLNCGCGPAPLLQLFRPLRKLTRKLFSVMPNTCYPSGEYMGSRTYFVDDPQYFARRMYEIWENGADILGGCCGTSPAHIRFLSDMLAAQKPSGNAVNAAMPVSFATQATSEIREPENFTAQTNPFSDALRRKERVVAVELDPPIDADFSHLAEAAPYLKKQGADAVTLADSPLARPRADSMLTAAKLQRECGISVIPHLSCRDRNAIGLKSVLLGGAMERLQNLLAVTGDPVPVIQRSEKEGKGVFSATSYQLLELVRRLNQDVLAGREYCAGGALNINARNFSAELARAQKKQSAGASFLMTQPVFEPAAIENLKLATATLHIPVLAGILPVASYKNACFLNNEVPGIHIPEEILHSLEGKTPEEAAPVSLAFSMEIIRTISPFCQGFYLMTPLKKFKLTGALTKIIKEERL